MEDEREPVEASDAKSMLAAFEHEDGERTVHTFIQAGMALVGADRSEASIHALIDEHGAELSGRAATAMGHGLVCLEGTRALFLATK